MAVSVTSSLKVRRRRVEFLTSGVWTAPVNVTQAIVTLVGGGASGGVGDRRDPSLGGGAGGVQLVSVPVSVTPGSNVPVTVGAGGAFVATFNGSSKVGLAGGASSFGTLSAPGGQPVFPSHPSAGSGATYAADATKGANGRSAGGGGYRIDDASLRSITPGGDSAAGFGIFSTQNSGGSVTAGSGRANSGAGGGAAWTIAGYNIVLVSGAGGSGIVIVEWEERS